MTVDTTINPFTRQEGAETQSATATEPTDRDRPAMEPSDESPISLDTIFDVLKNERRRRVLRYLAEQDGTVSVSDLAESLAALENSKSVAELTSKERKRVYVGLYQCHLPKLDDCGFIEYNQPRGSVELGPYAGHAERYLQQREAATNPWPTYYLGLVGVGWLIVLASLVAGPQATTVAVGLFLALSTTLALVHTYSRWREPGSPSFDSPS